jgi:hypothetical protein
LTKERGKGLLPVCHAWHFSGRFLCSQQSYLLISLSSALAFFAIKASAALFPFLQCIVFFGSSQNNPEKSGSGIHVKHNEKVAKKSLFGMR